VVAGIDARLAGRPLAQYRFHRRAGYGIAWNWNVAARGVPCRERRLSHTRPSGTTPPAHFCVGHSRGNAKTAGLTRVRQLMPVLLLRYRMLCVEG
jgi:hypothetical protein